LKPDVVLINYNAVVHYLLPLMPKSKVMSVLHSDDEDYYRVAAINRRFVHGWIAPTPRTKQGLLDYLSIKSIQNKIHVIPHGVKVSDCSRSDNFQYRFNIVFAGALYRHKGVDLVPEIFHKLKAICPEARLTILGDGEERKFLEVEFDRYGLIQDVSFLGVVGPEKVREIFSRSDVLLFPTRLEGFGLVIVEAMMEGVIPVVTYIESVTDSIITDGVNGYLVRMDDIGDFVARIENLYFNKSIAETMSSSARETAVEIYSQKVMAEKYHKVIFSE